MIRRRLIVWWNNLGKEREYRRSRRMLRQTIIRETKNGILIDLMLGHNIGDYEMDGEDLEKIIGMGKHSSYHDIKILYEKYRGVKNLRD